MILPPGSIEELVDAHSLRGMDKVAIAYRHDKLWAYATDGHVLARVHITSVSHDELERLHGLVIEMGADITKCAILLEADTYAMVRKTKRGCRFKKSDSSVTLELMNGSTVLAELDRNSGLVERIEWALEHASKTPVMGKLAFDMRLAAAAQKAIGPKADFLELEVPTDAEKGYVIRCEGSIAMMMPATFSEWTAVKQLVEVAQRTQGAISDRVLDTFGVKRVDALNGQ